MELHCRGRCLVVGKQACRPLAALGTQLYKCYSTRVARFGAGRQGLVGCFSGEQIWGTCKTVERTGTGRRSRRVSSKGTVWGPPTTLGTSRSCGKAGTGGIVGCGQHAAKGACEALARHVVARSTSAGCPCITTSLGFAGMVVGKGTGSGCAHGVGSQHGCAACAARRGRTA